MCNCYYIRYNEYRKVERNDKIMKETTSIAKKISTTKVVLGIVFSILILIVAQLLAFMISEVPLNLGVSGSICNIIAGTLYVVLTFIGVSVLCKKFFKIPMTEMRIPHFKVKGIWLMVSIFMPVLVVIFSIIAGGYWKINTLDRETTLATITSAIVFFGLATGIVEEVIFRGIIMRCLEMRFNIQIAIIVPSVLFGALHIIGNELDFISTIQVLIAGSVVGILFSLIAYQSKSIWNNAIVHSIWNMAFVGGILYIGNNTDSSSLFNFVLRNDNFLISGGDFGIEASIISIFVYLVFCTLTVVFLKKKNNTL